MLLRRIKKAYVLVQCPLKYVSTLSTKALEASELKISLLHVVCEPSEEELDHGEGGGVGDGAGVGQRYGQVGVAVAGVVLGLLLHAAPVTVVAVAHVLTVVTSFG